LQVKVWFQNRRTKHKRMQQEEDSKTGGNNNGSKSPSNHSYDEDDELIDMDMDDDGLSGDENDMWTWTAQKCSKVVVDMGGEGEGA